MPWEQEVCPCVHAMTCTVTRAAVSPYSGQRRGLASSGFLADVLPVCPHLRGTVPRERVHGRSLHPVLVGVHRTPSSRVHRNPSSWGITAPHPPGGSLHPILLGSCHTPSSWGITTPHPPGGSPHSILLGGHRTPSLWGFAAPHPPGFTAPRLLGGSPHPILLGSHHTPSACCWKGVEAVVSGQSRLGWLAAPGRAGLLPVPEPATVTLLERGLCRCD